MSGNTNGEVVDGFDFFTPDLNLPAPELDTSTVSNVHNHPSRSPVFVRDSVMDLFGQRIQMSGHDHDPNFEDEDVPMDNMDMGLFHHHSDLDYDPDFGYVVDDDVNGHSGVFCANCGDEFLESLSGSATLSEAGDLVEHDFFMADFRNQSGSTDRGDGMMDYFALGDDNVNTFAFAHDIVNDGNVDVNSNHDFEWEEIGGSVADRDVLSLLFQVSADDDASVMPVSGQVGRETNENRVNFEWEVLLNIHNLEVNHGFGLDNDYGSFTYNEGERIEEYETLFAQFGEDDNTLLGRPPASKAVVENLDSVLLSAEDVKNDNVICAVCKDEMLVRETAKQLPCSHRYHGDCIIPWLGIRNTCPVCRYELPTDDHDYELRKRGVIRGTSSMT